MTLLEITDVKSVRGPSDAVVIHSRAKTEMTTFVETCLNTLAGSAVSVEKRRKRHPRATRLLKLLSGKKNILVTTHQHPDPDALASAHAMAHLLGVKLKDSTVKVSVKGAISGGLNDGFTKHIQCELAAWDDAALAEYDAIVLVDVQPFFAYSPLPANVHPLAVIDHHRSRGRTPKYTYGDIRPEVGATASIIFSYFLELDVPIPPDLAAALLYAIETDLAGAAGTPGELDNLALSNLTLIANNRMLYQMRYVDLPQSYYMAYAQGLSHAEWFNGAIISHLDTIQTLEKPAVLADFLLRYDKATWALVTANHDGKFVISLRTSSTRISAAEMMRRLVKKLGDGGGHRSKAGGVIRLDDPSPAKFEQVRRILKRRLLRSLKIKVSAGQWLIPR